MIVLWIILWILLGILALALLIFLIAIMLASIPIRYKITATTGDSTTAYVEASYFFRLILFIYEYRNDEDTMSLRIFGFRKKLSDENGSSYPEEPIAETPITPIQEAEKSPQPKKSPPKGKEEEKSTFGETATIIQTALTYPHRKIIMKSCLGTLKKIIIILKPKKIDISGTVGFSDPAYTGVFIGAYESLVSMLRLRKQVRLAGDFDTPAFAARLNVFVCGSVSAIQLMIPLIKLIIQKPIRMIIKDLLW